MSVSFVGLTSKQEKAVGHLLTIKTIFDCSIMHNFYSILIHDFLFVYDIQCAVRGPHLIAEWTNISLIINMSPR